MQDGPWDFNLIQRREGERQLRIACVPELKKLLAEIRVAEVA